MKRVLLFQYALYGVRIWQCSPMKEYRITPTWWNWTSNKEKSVPVIYCIQNQRMLSMQRKSQKFNIINQIVGPYCCTHVKLFFGRISSISMMSLSFSWSSLSLIIIDSEVSINYSAVIFNRKRNKNYSVTVEKHRLLLRKIELGLSNKRFHSTIKKIFFSFQLTGYTHTQSVVKCTRKKRSGIEFNQKQKIMYYW